MKKIKRLLYLTHRWFGVALCLMITLWFSSGIVMMYVEYPELREDERTISLPPLDLDAVNISVEQLQNDILPSDAGIKSLILTTLFNRPVYQLILNRGQTVMVFADSGIILSSMSTDKALVSAAAFKTDAQPSFIGQIEMDQWTISGELNKHRPFYKIALNDTDNSILYVSSLTGQVVHDTQGHERFWNWIGSTVHWIYPMQLRRHSGVWANVVISLSLLGLIAVISGSVVGYLRLRFRKRYKNGSVTPYTGVQKWHHISGLICLVFIATFLVSGLFSMNPWGIFNNSTSPLAQIQRYQGVDYSFTNLQSKFEDVQKLQLVSQEPLKELEWVMLDGEGFFVGNFNSGRKLIGLEQNAVESKIKFAMAKFIPNQLSQVEKLDQFDNYYYSTHNRQRPLPVYRAVFDDDEESWFYVNALSGEFLYRSTSINRTERWLYNGLHSLDFRILLNHRPAWDIVVFILSLAGLAFCYTSIVIAWRRVLIKFGRKAS